jgi:hypothetical protein
MRPPDKRNARAGVPGASEGVFSLQEEQNPSVAQAPDQHQRKPLVDKFGNRHAESVLTNWSPTILKIMGVRRLEGGEP